MASIDFAQRTTLGRPPRRLVRESAPGILLFATAVAFHLAILFNLLPA
ncbi:hypothetical protein GF108_07275 [Phyllobacterium sp. SYP-B3895]|nr:hypothetical protein [Phyllobacterium sp. SYP-B3895]MRG55381.1 hypothetical protein [Phyllobacterium sp. SYP-B3895]